MRFALLLIGLMLASLPARAGEYYRFSDSHWMDYSTSSVAMTSGIGSQTRLIRLLCTTDCWFAIAISGQTAAAVVKGATSALLPADEPEYVIASPNSKVAVIRDASDGTINIVELTK